MTISISLGLSAAALFGVLWIQKRVGTRLSGLFAGLPLTTAPCAMIVWTDQGAMVATQTLSAAMIAGSAACFGFVTFAYLRSQVNLLLGCIITFFVFVAVCSIGLTIAGNDINQRAIIAASLLVCIMVISRALPMPKLAGKVRHCPMMITFPVTLMFVVAATLICRSLPATWGGVMAAAPNLGLIAIVINHLAYGKDSVPHIAKGYITGVASKLVFCVTLMYGLVFLN